MIFSSPFYLCQFYNHFSYEIVSIRGWKYRLLYKWGKVKVYNFLYCTYILYILQLILVFEFFFFKVFVIFHMKEATVLSESILFSINESTINCSMLYLHSGVRRMFELNGADSISFFILFNDTPWWPNAVENGI